MCKLQSDQARTQLNKWIDDCKNDHFFDEIEILTETYAGNGFFIIFTKKKW